MRADKVNCSVFHSCEYFDCRLCKVGTIDTYRVVVLVENENVAAICARACAALRRQISR